MDTVILAAGRGSRLEGVAAPFWKPLTPVNGEPLVVTVVRQGVTINLGRTVLVVSPENALPICQVLDAHRLTDCCDIVVQPSPMGPGEAFLRASPYLGGWSMILCADNIIPDDAIARFVAESDALRIGTRIVEDQMEADRFTYIEESGGIGEGGPACPWSDSKFRVWLGPLAVQTERLHDVLARRLTPGKELKIGSNLDAYLDGDKPTLIEVDCYDIGSAE